jgi:hypothetical protein
MMSVTARFGRPWPNDRSSQSRMPFVVRMTIPWAEPMKTVSLPSDETPIAEMLPRTSGEAAIQETAPRSSRGL